MTFLLVCVIKTSIIAAIALVMARLLPGKSAAVRHWILKAAVFCVLLTPLATLLLPPWNVGRVVVISSPNTPVVENVSNTVIGAAGTPNQSPVIHAEPLIRWIWLAGFALGVLKLSTGAIRLALLRRHSGNDFGKAWASMSDEISKRYELRHRVQLLRSRNSSILVTWGVIHPTILLPAGSWEWPEERIRVVLSHEMAHIRRGDWWIQTTAEFLRAAYWFNPLIWFLCQRLRVESEYACDDAVLAQGITGPQYAAHLLDIVNLLQITNRPWSSAPGMASPSTIERRFTAMLNARVNRRDASRFAMWMISIFGFGIAVPLAVLNTSARVQAEPRESAVAISEAGSSLQQAVRLEAPAAQPPSHSFTPVTRAVEVSAAQSTPAQAALPGAPTPQQPQEQPRGEIVTFHVRNLSLRDFFNVIGTASGLNIITDPSINNVAPITLDLTDVPWNQALDIVLRQNNLSAQLNGNELRILQAPTPRELFTITFEIYRNGTLIGGPRITTANEHQAVVAQGSTTRDGNVPGPDDIKISATPTRSATGGIVLDLEIFVGASGTRNSLQVSIGELRSISWRSSSGEPLEAKITVSEKQ